MTAARARRTGRTAAVFVGLALLAAAAFAGVLRNGFVPYDDGVYLTENPAVAGGLTLRGLQWAFTTTLGGNWHPLTWAVHLANVSLFGLQPAGHHAVSLALHVANTLLLFALLRGLTGALWRPALVAALFAVHPLHVESVAWAAELKDVLSTFLALAAALAWLRAVRRPARGWAIGAAVLYALALTAKPMPVTLPLLLLLLDWWPLGRWAPAADARAPADGELPALRRAWPLLREKAPLLLLAAASAAVAWTAQRAAGAVTVVEVLPLPARAATAVVSVVTYLAKTVWPSRLSFLYLHAGAAPPWWTWAGAAAVLALATAAAALLARRRPWLLAGWLWFLVSLLPVLGFVQVGAQSMADRYTYLALTGVFVAAAWSLGDLARGRAALAAPIAAASVALVAALCIATAARVAAWRDGATLFAAALAVDDRNWIVHNSFGLVLEEAGDPARAMAHYRRSIEINPCSVDAWTNLGAALAGLGRTREAIDAYRSALACRPTHADALYNLGLALWTSGSVAEAAASLEAATRHDPENANAWAALGDTRALLGRRDEARAAYARALALDPAQTHAAAGLRRLGATGPLQLAR
jgi:tetratricopeptide (TPR) repeat protein